MVEVADTSLRFDRKVKLPLYASSGIAELWIVDLQRRMVDVYRQPGPTAYASVTSHRSGDTIALALAPEISIMLARVFD